jgi:thiol:disulfide interchange protein DsbC
MFRLFILFIFLNFNNFKLSASEVDIVYNDSIIEILDFYDLNFEKFINKEDSIMEIYSKIDPTLINKEDIKQIQNSNLFKVKVGGKDFFASPDINYIFSGKAIKIFPENKKFQRLIIEEEDKEFNRKIFPLLNKEDLIYFKSKNNYNGSVFIFIDYTCPFCKKFHNRNLEKINNAGFDVYYIPFLRDNKNKRVRSNLYSIFCHKDNEYKKELINKAFEIELIFNNTEEDKNCSFSREYFNMLLNIGEYIKVEGTPTSLFYNGNLISGYIPLNQYFQVLKGNN